jgi:nucleoside-diphosphate-sugar epimerase
VVGASGFVGSRLAEWLILHDHATVRPITRSYKGHARLARFALDARIADATSAQALEPHLRGCEVVFHCVVGDHETILASIEATYQAAAAAGVKRLVYLSSAVVHGENPPPGANEDAPLPPNQRFSYNRSKVIAEERLARLRADGRVETVVLRPCIVFGPRSQFWTAQVAQDLRTGVAYLVGGGTGVCNTVYIDNLAQAMWLAATRREAANQTFLITDGERVTWRQLYESVATAIGMDLTGVASVDPGTVEEMARAQRDTQRAERLRSTIAWQMARPLVSRGAKALLRRTLARSAPAHPAAPPSSVVIKPQPVIDQEVASLQSWRIVLPITRAQSLLGYQPTVSFAEGARRTGEWLRFSSGMSADHGA